MASFRLLTEYHSFLLFSFDEMNEEEKTNSFRLLTEYHSFLSPSPNSSLIFSFGFPSPYGVSFILIKYEPR